MASTFSSIHSLNSFRSANSYIDSGRPGHKKDKASLPLLIIRGVLSPALRAPISLYSEEYVLVCREDEDKRSRLMASLDLIRKIIRI
jgi:hypothetical protein